jgi:hypothetical protein
MDDHPDHACIPLEVEMQRLHRDPPGSARLRRQLKREQRDSPTRAERVRARLAAVFQRRHA